MNVRKDILWRVYASFILLLLFAVAIVVQVLRVQVGQGKKYRTMAQEFTTKPVNIEPIRGNIYAADGSLLATSLPIYDLRMDLKSDALTKEVFNSNIDSLSLCLASYFKDKSAGQYKQMLVQGRKNGSRYFLIKRGLNHNELKDILEFPIFRLGRYKGGLIVEQKSRRIRPFRMLAARTLGYNRSGLPVGLEGAYDNYLAGINGKRLMQKVAGGNWIPINDDNEIDPRNGQDIITSIDVNIQDVTEDALMRELQKHEAEHGCAVVMEVETGRIVSIANLKRQEDGSYYESYNYAVGESMEPGSTFKLASMIALLEEKMVVPEDTFHTYDGSYKFFDRTMRDSREGGYGTITMNEAFAVSSNVAISRAVFNHFYSDPQKFMKHMKHMRLDEPLGLQIAGEGQPYFKDPKDRNWSGITLPWMSIGYELKMTPLQMLTLYNAVANKGRMMQPMMVTEVREVGKLVEKFEPQERVRKICSDKTLAEVQKMLEMVVDSGTADNLKNTNYTIAGKTGTALIARDGNYKRERIYQASFVGYFPADNPRYSCIVVVNQPKKGLYYGSWVAGPVFKEIADKIYANDLYVHKKEAALAAAPYGHGKKSSQKNGISPTKRETATVIARNLDIEFLDDEGIGSWVSLETTDSIAKIKTRAYPENKIPDVRGMVLSDALPILENRGLKVNFQGTGKIVSQSIKPGTELGYYSNITLTLN